MLQISQLLFQYFISSKTNFTPIDQLNIKLTYQQTPLGIQINQKIQSNTFNSQTHPNPCQIQHNHMQKRQQINLQQQYDHQHFLQPEDLDTDQLTPPQYASLTQQNSQLTTSNTTQTTQQPKRPTPTTTPSPKNIPSKKTTPSQRSNLQQQSESQQQIRKQRILQFKISQLQKICTTLTSANEKLLDKIQELQQQNEQYKQRVLVLQQTKHQRNTQNNYAESLNDSRQSIQGNQSVTDSNYQHNGTNRSQEESQLLAEDDQDDRLLEDEVGDIQLMIKEYRQDLTNAEQLNKTIKDSLTQKIHQLQDQLSTTNEQLAQTQTVNSQMEQQLIEMQQRNQSLERQIQTIITSTNPQPNNNTPHDHYYYEDPTARNHTESRSSQYMTPVHRANYHQRLRPYYDQQYQQQQNNQFDSSVQLQLEKLIQKLVHQLQHQRSVKKRMNQEMKRIQKDLLQNEKEIMVKNKKIYQLEMNLLKGEKNHLFNSNNIPLSTSQIQPFNNHNEGKTQQRGKYTIFSPSREQTHTRNYNSPNNKDISPKIRDKYLQPQRHRVNTSAVNYSPPNRQSPPVSQAYTKTPNYSNLSRNPNMSQLPSSAQTKHLQTFSLLQLLNESSITLSVKQKLHISLKLVQYYQQKIYQYKNYNLLMLENVLVTNFNRIKLGLVKIRVQEHKRSEEGNQRIRKNSRDEVADGPEKVIWNLGFLLNSLLLDVPTKEDDLGNSNAEQNILGLIDNILDNRSLNKEVLTQLRDSLGQALQQRLK